MSKVFVLFSKNKKVGSRLISWASGFENLKLNSYPSHVAVLVDNTVIESVFSQGIRLVPYEKWKLINQEICKIEIVNADWSFIKEEMIRLWGRKYDWLGISYFTWRFLLLILFKRKLPEANRWQRSYNYFCTELAGKLLNIKCDMVSPAKLLKYTLDKQNEPRET